MFLQVSRVSRRMVTKYKFPLHLYLIFENVEPMVYTHDNLTANHYVILIPENQIYNLSCVLKNEVLLSLNYLVDISVVDTLKFSKFLPEISLNLSKNRFLLQYMFYMYFLKIRLSVFTFNDLVKSSVMSIEKNYDNAGWLEREISEMFQIGLSFKKDNRNLLLDYSQNEHPLLKDFPVEGYKDLYYNFTEENLTYLDHNYIEL